MTTLANLPVRVAACGVLILGVACSSAPKQQPIDTSVRMEPLPARPDDWAVRDSAPGAVADLPALQVSQMTGESPGSGRIVEFDARNQDLRLVLQGIAEQFGMGFSIDPAVAGTVTQRLRDVTLEEALRDIVPPQYTYNLQGGVLRVMPVGMSTRIFSLDYVSLSRIGTSTTVIQRRLAGSGSQGSSGAGTTGTTGTTNQQGVGGGGDAISSIAITDFWQEVKIALEGLMFATVVDADAGTAGGVSGFSGGATGASSRSDASGQKLVINPMAGTVLVATTPETMQQIEAYIAALETSVQRQVRIEAKIVEVSLDRNFQFGIDWGALQRVGNVDLRLSETPGNAGAIQLTLGGGNQQVSAVLDLLDTQGDVRVLSSPGTNAMNNQRAIFNATRDEVFFAVSRQPIIGPTGATIGFDTEIQPQQVAVGIVLDVLPQIGADNIVSMNIRPAITTVARVERIELEDGTQASAPVIDRREVDTFARVRPGETIIIGGLIQTRSEEVRSGVPFLMDIPWLGNLFARTERIEEKSELVVFITPTIVAGQPPSGN